MPESQWGGDDATIQSLLDNVFGAERFGKAAYRLRDGRAPVAALSFVACDESRGLLGTIRFWEIQISDTRALLLGPLAVDPACQGQGIGKGLIARGFEAATELGFDLVLLVGDQTYYSASGFARVPEGRVILPGLIETHRLLVHSIGKNPLPHGEISPGL